MESQKTFEIRVLRNHINNMPKTYRARKENWQIAQSILLSGTSKAGMTSSIEKCRELGIDPYGHTLERED